MSGIGLAIGKDDKGKPYMFLDIRDESMCVSVFLCDADNADHAVGELIRGLKTVKADLKREASGLVIPEMGVIPNVLRKS